MPIRPARYGPKGVVAEDPRQRLVEAGLDLFGKFSFEGASTRMLAERAQVNLAAITYYFGGKQGLYLAVADHITEQINGLLGDQLARVQEALKNERLSKEQSFFLLGEWLQFLITRFLGRAQTDKWLSIIVREQLWPTDAFGILFEGFMRPLDQALFGLVARIMGLKPDDQEVKLRALAIKGEIQIFQISRSAVKRTLNWKNYGPENLDAIRRVIMDNLSRIFSISPECSYTRSDAGNVQ
jgi:TetR/AcrR family transcriptional regulator, regulator of cefoperazone and chloramphenicol sensitivity